MMSEYLMCIPCGIHYTGVARVGIPCAYCDFLLVDVESELMKLAETYDPIRWLARSP